MASGIEKEGRTDRRSFLNWIWVGLGALVTLEFVWVALSFLRSRPSRAAVEKTGTVVIAGRVDDFEKNSVTAFQRGGFIWSGYRMAVFWPSPASAPIWCAPFPG